MSAPDRKVTAGALAGALSVILVWVLSEIGVEPPAEVASALTVILTFGVSYAVPNKEAE